MAKQRTAANFSVIRIFSDGTRMGMETKPSTDTIWLYNAIVLLSDNKQRQLH
jgi:hypothetical protein